MRRVGYKQFLSIEEHYYLFIAFKLTYLFYPQNIWFKQSFSFSSINQSIMRLRMEHNGGLKRVESWRSLIHPGDLWYAIQLTPPPDLIFTKPITLPLLTLLPWKHPISMLLNLPLPHFLLQTHKPKLSLFINRRYLLNLNRLHRALSIKWLQLWDEVHLHLLESRLTGVTW